MARTTLSTSAAALALVASALAGPAASGSGPGRGVLTVDDDGQQCGAGSYRTIGAAVAAARDGDRIKVCPGRYTEHVTVTKSVTIAGQVGATSSYACLDPSTPAALDPTAFAVLEPAAATNDATQPLLTLAADDVDVSGLAFRGVLDEVPDGTATYPFYTPALATDDAHSGYRLHHNLFRDNTLAVELGSDGQAATRVDHNCLRENEYGVANQRYELARATLDANSTYRTVVTAYEIGWGFAGTDRVTVRSNTSVEDRFGVYLENSKRALLAGNKLTRPGERGLWVLGANDGVDVVGNTVTSTPGPALQGLQVSPPTGGAARTTGLLVVGNRISGFQTPAGVGSGIVLGVGAVEGASIVGNDLSSNRSGILVAPGNTGNRIVANHVHDNLTVGIRVVGTGNQIVANVALDNALDALDQTDPDPSDGIQLLNTWTANRCVTDSPAGAIC